MNTLLKIALVITIIGALNWGLVAMFDYNLVEAMFGVKTLVTRMIYIVILAAGVLDLALLFKDLDGRR